MDNFFQNVKHLAKHVGETEEKVRKSVIRVFRNMTEPNPSIKDVAELIIAHPDAEKKILDALNIRINVYTIKKDNIEYRLETKGKENQKIMEVDVKENGLHVVKYRWYDEKEKLSQKNHLSKKIFFSLFE